MDRSARWIDFDGVDVVIVVVTRGVMSTACNKLRPGRGLAEGGFGFASFDGLFFRLLRLCSIRSAVALGVVGIFFFIF